MLGSMFFVFGDTIMAFLLALSGSLRNMADSPDIPEDSTFIKKAEFMFPENFLSRYPHEANSYRLKIFGYLIFNLLVKGYSTIDPAAFWVIYNRDDFYRTAIDAVFYEYLTNFTDREAKYLLFDPFESAASDLSVSKETAVDRIGQHLDLLSDTESQPERLKGAYDTLSETDKSPAISEPRTDECDTHTVIDVSGVPGIDYPNFCDIPKTSFSCAQKRIPGIYADYETGCQAFHVCWPHRIDSFLCPIGTTFNQSLLTCNFWHETDCYSSPLLFKHDQFLIDGVSTELDIPEYDGNCETLLNKPLRLHTKFLPAKCEVQVLDDSKQDETKSREKDADELKERLETVYNLVKEMLDKLKEIRIELANEMGSRGNPWIHVLGKRLESLSVPEFGVEAMGQATELTRKIGETDFKPTKDAEQLNPSEKLSSGVSPDLYVTSSLLLKPSMSFEEHIKRREEGMIEIVMRSLSLGGDILNEDVIPITKQLIMDNYRKIISKKH